MVKQVLYFLMFLFLSMPYVSGEERSFLNEDGVQVIDSPESLILLADDGITSVLDS